jgi:hypothetical protein
MNKCTMPGFSSTVQTPSCNQLATPASSTQSALGTALAIRWPHWPAFGVTLGGRVRCCWRGFAEA